jgi:hypothetical protein
VTNVVILEDFYNLLSSNLLSKEYHFFMRSKIELEEPLILKVQIVKVEILGRGNPSQDGC